MREGHFIRELPRSHLALPRPTPPIRCKQGFARRPPPGLSLQPALVAVQGAGGPRGSNPIS